nr:GldG family protein [uncultured Ruminococcus sp.]
MFKKNKKEDFLATEIEKDIKADETSTDEVTEKEETSDVEVKKQSKIKKILHSRKFSRGWLSIAIIAVFLACVVAVNIIASVLENKFPSLSVDITSSNMYQLQDDTKKLCKNVNKDIDIYLLSDEDTFTSYDSSFGVAYFSQALQFFKEIAALNSHITFKFEDTASNPSFAKKYSNLNLTTSGSSTICVIDAGNDRYKGLSMTDFFETENDSSTGYTKIKSSKVEQAVCTAILGLTKENVAKACFVTSSGVNSSYFSTLKTFLDNQAYSTSTVDLDSNNKVPNDCDILLFVAPTTDISEQALKKVNDYLNTAKKSNKTFVYIPAPAVIDGGTPNMDSFLEEQGIKIDNKWIYEEDNDYLTPLSPNDNRLSTFDYDDSDFTDGIDSSTKVAMFDTWNITLTKGSSAKVLLKSSKKADLLPTDAKSTDDIKKGSGKALNGAVINQSEVSDGVNKNVVVIGSYDALCGDLLTKYSQYNNSKYFANLFNLLTENDGETITINSATASDTSLGLEAASDALFPSILFVGIIPLGVLILGIVIWAVRRKK